MWLVQLPRPRMRCSVRHLTAAAKQRDSSESDSGSAGAGAAAGLARAGRSASPPLLRFLQACSAPLSGCSGLELQMWGQPQIFCAGRLHQPGRR